MAVNPVSSELRRAARIGAIACLLGLAACTPGSSTGASLGTPAGLSLSVSGTAPAVHADLLGDYTYVLPGAAIHRDGTWHAWMVGLGSDPTAQRPFHLTSTDGVTWQLAEGDLVAELGITFTSPGPIPSSVLVDQNGHWVMYLWGLQAPSTRGPDIWRATAPGPSGPWTADPNPVIGHGSPGTWDADGVEFPTVVATSSGYLMLFGGATDPITSSIGAATSTDGISWTLQGGPVISPGFCGAFDARGMWQARLVAEPGGGYVAVYGGDPGTEEGLSLGLARSPDGTSWRCASPSAALEFTAIPGSSGIHSWLDLTDGGTTRLLVESLLPSGSELWLADLKRGS